MNYSWEDYSNLLSYKQSNHALSKNFGTQHDKQSQPTDSLIRIESHYLYFDKQKGTEKILDKGLSSENDYWQNAIPNLDVGGELHADPDLCIN